MSCNSACGSVTFQVDGQGAWASAALDTSGNASVGGPSGPGPGTHTVTVNYSGDASFNPASGSTTYTIVKSSPTVRLDWSSPSTLYGQLQVFLATLIGGNNPTGTVQFQINGATFGTIAVSGNTARYSNINEIWPPGVYTISEVYGGDALNNPASTSLGGFTVFTAIPVVSISSSSLNPPRGGSVTLTANVSNLPNTIGSAPSGSVTFYDGANAIGTATLANGTANFATPVLADGVHSFSLQYPGDANFRPATSGSLSVTSGPGPLVVELAATPSSGAVGTAVSMQALLDTGGARAVGGSVAFLSNGSVIGTAPLTSVSATNILPQNSLAAASQPMPPTVTANSTTAPDSTMTAVAISFPALSSGESYGEINSLITPAAGLTYTYSVLLRADSATTAKLRVVQQCGANDTMLGVSVGTTWQRYSLTHTMVSACSATPSALLVRLNETSPSSAVTIYTWGAQLEQSSTVGPYVSTNGAPATGTGAVASMLTTALPAGSDKITVTYAGDAANQPGTGGPVTVQIAVASPSIALASSLNSSQSGQSVVWTATLRGVRLTRQGW